MQGSNFVNPMMDIPWTNEEHNLFLQGYLLYGKCWIEIAEVVRTRNAYQVCSYATWLESHGCLPRLPPIQNTPVKPIPIQAAETVTTQNVTAAATAVAQAGAFKKGMWHEEEHNLFLEGLRLHGRGSWSKIAQHVKTRSSTQVISHARTYFRKIEKLNEEVSGTKRKAPDDEKPVAKKKIAVTVEETTKKTSAPKTSNVSPVVETKTVTSSSPKKAEPIKTVSSNKSDSTTLDIHPPSIKSEDVGQSVVPPKVEKTKPLDDEKNDEAVGEETKQDAVEPLDSGCKISSDDLLEPKMPIMAIGFLVSILGLLAGTTLWMMGSETGGNFVDGFYVGTENAASEL